MAVIRAHESSVKGEVANDVKDTARYTWTNQQDFEYVGCAIFFTFYNCCPCSQIEEFRLFQTVEEQEAYMVEHEFVSAHASFLERKRRYAEAAELYLREGRTLYAIELLRDSTGRTSRARARDVVMERLWFHLSFGIQPNFDGSDESIELKELFRFLKLFIAVELDAKNIPEVVVLFIYLFLC